MEIKSIIVIFAKVFFSFPVNIAYWLVLVLIGFQYYRLINNETKLLGRPRNSVWEQLLSSALYGIAGGFFAAVLLFISGISLFEIGIQYVWPLALLLLFIHPRFLCFAYAGGIVGAAAALVQLLGRSWPLLRAGIFSGLFNLYIPGLLALIGILHLTESLLIALSGHLYPSPVYLETEHGIVGAFSLQKFWILPLVGMVAEVVSVAEAAGGGYAGMVAALCRPFDCRTRVHFALLSAARGCRIGLWRYLHLLYSPAEGKKIRPFPGRVQSAAFGPGFYCRTLVSCRIPCCPVCSFWT